MRLLATLLALLCVVNVRAQSGLVAPTLEAVVSPPYYGSTGDEGFGSVLAVGGDYAAVSGLHFGVYDLTGSGEVHVLRRTGSGWARSQTIIPTGPNEFRFGADIVIKDSLMFVGSPFAGPDSGLSAGAVYIYKLEGTEWVQSDVIRLPPPPGVRTYFGEALDFDGQRLIIGARFATGRGRAYIFENLGGAWSLTASLTAPGSDGAGFGEVVAIDGTHAVVVDIIGVTGGARIHAFELVGTGWQWEADLGPGGVGLASGLLSLALEGDRLLVGAPMISTGRVYTFQRAGSSWSSTGVLADDAGGIDPPAQFGADVQLDEGRALIGSPRLQRALLFAFNGSTWARSAVLAVAETPELRFGNAGEAVALDGNRALLGSPRTQIETAYGAGAVHAFELGPTGGALVSNVTLGPVRSGHRFGTDVALSGNRVAVCAGGSTLYGQASPSVYVFSVVGGVSSMETRIATGCTAVAIGPDQLFVGNPSAVSVYTRGPSGWSPSQTLSGNGAFGSALSLDGDRLLVGAPAGIETAQGQAYLYERASGTWRIAQILRPEIPEGSASFGTSVALDGARAVVGSPRSTAGGPSVGLAYVYERDGAAWERVAVLNSPSPENDGLFGTSVAVSGGRALVGARSEPGGDGGGATVFDGLSWTSTVALVGPGSGSSFGSDVALDGGRALIGARIDADSLGRAFLYGYDGARWSQTAALVSPSPVAGEAFGTSVAVEGRRIAVGAPFGVVGAPVFGKVYLYQDRITVADETAPLANTVRLQAPHPNPSSGTSRLVLTLGQPERVTATVYDALGRSIQTILNGEAVGGEVALTIDGRLLSPGLYVVRVVGETFAESARLVVAR
ncbi:MAG TPA: T9SS type A sorting domain-containing protein [Rubricoccaceae bacterium]|jgi:hypothetical protein